EARTLIVPAVCLATAFAAILPAVRRHRTGRALIYFAGFFFVTLLPVSNLIVLIGSIMAERFLYLPSVGLAGCVAAAVYTLAQRHPQSARVAWAAEIAA